MYGYSDISSFIRYLNSELRYSSSLTRWIDDFHQFLDEFHPTLQCPVGREEHISSKILKAIDKLSDISRQSSKLACRCKFIK